MGWTDADWAAMRAEGKDFLVERARMERTTTYTELNAALVRRTGTAGFDFDYQDHRAAMGRLLGDITADAFTETGGRMLSAIVIYLNANDPGPGFYKLAKSKRLLGESDDRNAFWVEQLNGLYRHYRRSRARR